MEKSSLQWLVLSGLVCVISCKQSSSGLVFHQRPYLWDAFPLPEQRFTNTSVADVVSAVNAVVARASNGSVTQAVCLDKTPADIIAYSSDLTLKVDVEQLIADFKTDETNWMNRGARGFETFPYTGTLMARHSLACGFQELVMSAGLNYEEKTNAIHLRRNPAHLECRSYAITSGLKQMAQDLAKRNQVRVGVDPVTSAFIDAAKVYLWSIDVPAGRDELTGEPRYGKVFKYLQEKSVLLVIETPEAHAGAMKNLKERGLWANP